MRSAGDAAVNRLVDPLVRLFQPVLAPSRELTPADAAGDVLPRFLAWRRRTLALVVLLTGLTAALDAAARLLVGPRPSLPDLLQLEAEAEPVQQSAFGDLADRVWVLSVYALPTSALLAAACGARPRAPRAILAAGWVGSFLVPAAIALAPWDWWSADPGARRVERLQRVAEGVTWGVYYVAVLSPAVLATVPGLVRACLRVKLLLPAAALPGWLLVAAAPLHGLLVLVTFVCLAQVAPGPLLLAAMVLWLAAPLAYLARADVFTRPLASADDLRRARRVQAVARALALGSAGCLAAHAATWEGFGVRLVGLDPATSLVRPWEVVRYGLDVSGRALFVTALVADLLLGATRAAWRHDRAFRAGPGAAEFDRLMERLEADRQATT